MGTSLLDVAIQLSGSVLLKYRKYISSPGEAPDGAKVEQGTRGGYYYETSSRSGAQEKPKRPAGTPREQPRERGVGQQEQSRQSARPDLATWTVKDNGDTMALYTNPDGSWKPEREKKHQEILASIFDGIPSVENPAFYLMGGGTAAGKSSILGAGGVNVPSETQGAWIDSDKIKSMLPEYNELQQAGNPAGAAIVHEESSYIAKRALRMAIERSTHTVLDGTGDSSLDSLKKKTDQYHQAGQRVVANYCSQPTEQSIKNSAARAARTGRVVPESILRGTHRDVSRILPEALKANLFDECNLYDTSIKGQPRLVLSHKDGKTQVHDPELWKVFLAKGEEGESPPQQQVTASLDKARRYVSDPTDAPPGVKVEQGKRGGYYYETDANAAGPSDAPKVKRRGGTPKNPYVQALAAGQATKTFFRQLVFDAEAFSRTAPGSEERHILFDKIDGVLKAFDSVDDQVKRDNFPRDAGDIMQLSSMLMDVHDFVHEELRTADQRDYASNHEYLVLEAVQNYCQDGIQVLNKLRQFGHIPPELHEQGELVAGLFDDYLGTSLHRVMSREDTMKRFEEATETTRTQQMVVDRQLLHKYARPSVGRLPEAHLALVEHLDIDDYGNNDLKGASKLAPAHAMLYEGTVKLHYRGMPLSGEHYRTEVVTHEIGHVVHGALLRSSHPDARRLAEMIDGEFKAARTKAGLPVEPASRESWVEINTTTGKAALSNAPSDYSLTNSHEWFAEQYADYVYYPSRLSKNFPKVYEAMQKVFGGTTYKTSHAVPVPPGTDTAHDDFIHNLFQQGHELDEAWGAIP